MDSVQGPDLQACAPHVSIEKFFLWKSSLFFFFNGFCFCSLENIYKELSTDIEDFTHPGHGDLTGWAKQGNPSILLL